MKMIQLGAAAFFAAIAVPAHAVMTPESQREIEHLIDHVGASGCDFNRNGTWYSSDRGRSHLRDKYDYAKKRGLSTAEEFIDKIASSSSVSNRPYKVRCSGREIIASAFLKEELQRYRNSGSASAAASVASTPTASNASPTAQAPGASSAPSARSSSQIERPAAQKAAVRQGADAKPDRN